MRCPYYIANRCRSCSELKQDYSLQITIKQDKVAQLLADFVTESQWLEPVLSPEVGFRNRAKLVVSGKPGKLQFGIFDEDFRGVDLRYCPLYDQSMQRTIAQVAAYLNDLKISSYNVKKRTGQLKYVLLTQSSTGKYLLRLVLAGKKWLLPIRKTLAHLHKYCPNLEVVSVNILPQAVALLEGKEEIILTEKTELDFPLEVLSKQQLPLKLGPQCFFQTNTSVATKLYAQAVSWSQESKDLEGSVVDLFCGVGGFGLALAQANPKRSVYGVEISQTAISCAEKSAAQMGLENTIFTSGSAELVIDTTESVALGAEKDRGGSLDFLRQPAVMVVNPPRRGIGANLAGWINQYAQPEKLIYSSCNPISLTQDLRMLTGYQVISARIFDMFPHTKHVETVCLMSRKEK